MLELLDQETVQKEATFLTGMISRELVAVFGKDPEEAQHLVEKYTVKENLINNPILLHESPNKWALTLLANNNDIEAIEKYYYA